MKAMLNGFSLSMPTAAGLFSSWFLLAGPVLAEAPAITRVSEGLERSAAAGGDTAAFNLFGE
ncbi:MAG: hypothetical protein Q8O57_01795, partial [Kiritimatiellota bacterium]|nr:hypothetical protein [Kiritimatiellota bacterium]